MDTTFILHGGATSTDSPDNDKFFSYFTSLVDSQEVKILLCYWARPKVKWQDILDRDKPKVLSLTEKRVVFTLADNPQQLLSEIESHDALYVAGGDAELIEPFYNELTGLKEKLAGKVYLGSSMGAFIISHNYVLSFDSQDSKSVHKGLGILPINSLAHWDQEDHKEEKIALIKQKSDLPILTLNEGESVSFIV